MRQPEKRAVARKRKLVAVAYLFFLAAALVPRAHAQEIAKPSAPDLRSALLVPAPFLEPLPGKADFHPESVPARLRMSAGERRTWFLLGLAQHGAAFFDAHTTRVAMRHYHELDPFMRPFAHSAAIYPVMQIGPLGLDWLATRLATSRHRWLRRLWWVPQAAATAGFLWSAAHNLQLPAVPGSPAH